jgi:single-stranded DNA-binding protein
MTYLRTAQTTLYGSLGGDPEVRTRKAYIEVHESYDFALNEIVVEERARPERKFRVASLVQNSSDNDGKETGRWHHLVDFGGYLKSRSKGDRLKVTGYFRTRTYFKDGAKKAIRELIITNVEVFPGIQSDSLRPGSPTSPTA